MLSDEEREAIEKIKRFNQYNWEMNNLKGKEFAKPYFESLDTLLNLIEKKSKEIEELNKENLEIRDWKYVIDSPIDLDKLKELDLIKIKGKEYVSKDKLKAKIGERMQKNNNIIHNAKLKYGKDYVYYDDVQEAKEENCICKEILQSLLEKE